MKNGINVMLSVGDIVVDNKGGKKHRVVAIVGNEITLCEMGISQFVLSLLNKETLFNLVETNDLVIQKEEPFVFNKDDLSDSAKEKFEIKQKMMLEVVNAYAPSFIELSGRKSKKM